MRTYTCDKCGATFTLDTGDLDDVCPECYSDRTVLLSDDRDFDDLTDDLVDDLADAFAENDDDFDDDFADEDY